ncbi:hypothetical protein D3C78_1860310 [compost metagenome]
MMGAQDVRHQGVDISTEHLNPRTAPKRFGSGIEKHHSVVIINDHNGIDRLLQCLYEKVFRLCITRQSDFCIHCCYFHTATGLYP